MAFKKESQLHKVHTKCHAIIPHAEKQIHPTWREILVSTSLAKLKDFPSAPACFSLSLSLSMLLIAKKPNLNFLEFSDFPLFNYLIGSYRIFFFFFLNFKKTLLNPNPVLFFSNFFLLKCK